MVTGDLDNNGRDEVIFVFAGAGALALERGQLVPGAPLTAGSHGGRASRRRGGDDLIIDFPGVGIWGSRQQQRLVAAPHAEFDVDIVTADLNGNGRDEVLMYVPRPWRVGLSRQRHVDPDPHAESRVYRRRPPRHRRPRGSGDRLRRGSGRMDVIATMPRGHCCTRYPLRASRSWTAHATLSDEIIIDFGPAVGLWQFASTGVWSSLHSLSPEDLTSGRLR